MRNRRIVVYMLIIVVVLIGFNGTKEIILGNEATDTKLTELLGKYTELTKERDAIAKQSNNIIISEAISENDKHTPIYKKTIDKSDKKYLYRSLASIGDTDAMINELFGIMAEVAVDKAKSNTLNIVIKKIQKAFNQKELGSNFPATKRIVDSLTVSTLSSSSQSLVNALVIDCGSIMEKYISVNNTYGAVSSRDIELLFKLFYSTIMDGKNDPVDLMNSFAMIKWSNDKINIILIAVRTFEKMPDVSPEEMIGYIDDIIDNYNSYCIKNGKVTVSTNIINRSELLMILRSYDKAVRNGAVYTSSSGEKLRLKELSDLYFSMLRIIMNDEDKCNIYINTMERLINARIQNNNQEFVTAIFDIIELTLKDKGYFGFKQSLKQINDQLDDINERILGCKSENDKKAVIEVLKNCKGNLKDIEENAESAYKDYNKSDLNNYKELYGSYSKKYESIQKNIKTLKDNIIILKGVLNIDHCLDSEENIKIGLLIDSIDGKITEWDNKLEKYIAFYNSEIGMVIKRFKRIKPLVNAAVAYTATYSSDQTDEKDLKESRKQIVENLITETANRYERYDEWIFSIGINTGFMFPGHTKDGWNFYPPQVSLPLGFYLQSMPEENSGFSLGHIGLYFFDLGQYVFYDKNSDVKEASWKNAFTLGMQLGFFIFSSPDMLFNAGIDVRYSPALHTEGEKRRDDIWAGVYCSYYVPFFDFN